LLAGLHVYFKQEDRNELEMTIEVHEPKNSLPLFSISRHINPADLINLIRTFNEMNKELDRNYEYVPFDLNSGWLKCLE